MNEGVTDRDAEGLHDDLTQVYRIGGAPQPVLHWNGPVDRERGPYIDCSEISQSQRNAVGVWRDAVEPLSRLWSNDRLSAQQLREKLE